MKDAGIFEAHGSYVLSLVFSRQASILASAGMDQLIKLWSVPGWELVKNLQGHSHSVNSIALSPDGTLLASSSTDETVKLWSFPEGQLLTSLQDRKKVVSTIQFSPDGKWIAAGSYGGRVMIWTVQGEPVVGFKANPGNLSAITFSPDGNVLATSGLGDHISVWNLPSGELVTRLVGHRTAVGSLAFINKGAYLVSLGLDGTIRFWEAGTWQEIQALQRPAPGIRGLVVSPDGSIAALSTEAAVELRRLKDWTLQAKLSISTKVVSAMAFSPDMRWLAVGGADRKIRVWEMD